MYSRRDWKCNPLSAPGRIRTQDTRGEKQGEINSANLTIEPNTYKKCHFRSQTKASWCNKNAPYAYKACLLHQWNAFAGLLLWHWLCMRCRVQGVNRDNKIIRQGCNKLLSFNFRWGKRLWPFGWMDLTRTVTNWAIQPCIDSPQNHQRLWWVWVITRSDRPRNAMLKMVL